MRPVQSRFNDLWLRWVIDKNSAQTKDANISGHVWKPSQVQISQLKSHCLLSFWIINQKLSYSLWDLILISHQKAHIIIFWIENASLTKVMAICVSSYTWKLHENACQKWYVSILRVVDKINVLLKINGSVLNFAKINYRWRWHECFSIQATFVPVFNRSHSEKHLNDLVYTWLFPEYLLVSGRLQLWQRPGMIFTLGGCWLIWCDYEFYAWNSGPQKLW